MFIVVVVRLALVLVLSLVYSVLVKSRSAQQVPLAEVSGYVLLVEEVSWNRKSLMSGI